jgi:glycosyltransferase involved in cell wall biosynthesis
MAGVGLTPLEAIMQGTPVVVTKECGELIQELDCGYIVRYGDVKGLADTIIHVLMNPEEGKRKSLKGRHYIERELNWGKAASKVEGVYHECITRRGG